MTEKVARRAAPRSSQYTRCGLNRAAFRPPRARQWPACAWPGPRGPRRRVGPPPPSKLNPFALGHLFGVSTSPLLCRGVLEITSPLIWHRAASSSIFARFSKCRPKAHILQDFQNVDHSCYEIFKTSTESIFFARFSKCRPKASFL